MPGSDKVRAGVIVLTVPIAALLALTLLRPGCSVLPRGGAVVMPEEPPPDTVQVPHAASGAEDGGYTDAVPAVRCAKVRFEYTTSHATAPGFRAACFLGLRRRGAVATAPGVNVRLWRI